MKDLWHCWNAGESRIFHLNFNNTIMKILKPAFDLNSVKIRISDLEETANRKNYKKLISYNSILSSIREVGIIQPLVVCISPNNGKYKILDGHVRFYALRELKQKYVYCIIANDNERYTFDAQINNLSTFQKAAMIAKAVKNRVSVKRIASALGISEKQILSDMNVTEGLDGKVVEILKTANVTSKSLRELKRVRNARQIQIAQMMKSSNNYSLTFVSSLVSASLPCDFHEGQRKTGKVRMDFSEIRTLEAASDSLEVRAKESLEKYHAQIFDLVTVIGFLRRLMEDDRINGYISRNFAGYYPELKKISENEDIMI